MIQQMVVRSLRHALDDNNEHAISFVPSLLPLLFLCNHQMRFESAVDVLATQMSECRCRFVNCPSLQEHFFLRYH